MTTHLLEGIFVLLVVPIAGLCINPDFVYQSETVGDVETCRFSGNHSMGVCKPVNECPGVISDLNVHNVPPTPCGFDDATPVACCVQPDQSGQLEARISAMQCKSYTNTLSTNMLWDTARPVVASVDKVPLKFQTIHMNDPRPEVAGGVPAAPAEFPHMAALGWSDGATVLWKCGGTVISDQFVLTAAHCVVTPPDVVRMGENNLLAVIISLSDFRIGQIIVYPSYKASSSYDDIALIKLKAPVVLGPQIRPACLWQTQDLRELECSAEQVVATGYGLTEYGGQPSDGLLKVNLTLVDTVRCSELYPPVRKIANGLQDGQLCAGDENGIKDTCQGDSGGPLQVKRLSENGQIVYYIIGITSFGRGCATQTPGVYTRVSYYLKWIEDIVWP